MLQVSVIGPSSPYKKERETAYRIGSMIGEMKAVLITGGRGGIMEAASCGAKEKGGLTVGILPSDFEDANPCVQIKIPTHMNELRNFLVISSANIVVSVGISNGTLIELAIAHKLGKPVYSFFLPDKYSHLSTKTFKENQLNEFKKVLLSYANKHKP